MEGTYEPMLLIQNILVPTETDPFLVPVTQVRIPRIRTRLIVKFVKFMLILLLVPFNFNLNPTLLILIPIILRSSLFFITYDYRFIFRFY